MTEEKADGSGGTAANPNYGELRPRGTVKEYRVCIQTDVQDDSELAAAKAVGLFKDEFPGDSQVQSIDVSSGEVEIELNATMDPVLAGAVVDSVENI